MDIDPDGETKKPRMSFSKKTFFLLFLLFVGVSIAYHQTKSDSIATVHADEVKARNFKLRNASGQRMSLSQHYGKRPVLLAFWATWCGYCRKEIPNLTGLRNDYAQSDLEIYGINLRESKQKAMSFAKRAGINYEILFDTDGRVADQYQVSGIPTMIVIDKKGRIIARDYGVSSNIIRSIKKIVYYS